MRIVKFTSKYPPYNSGETAGFDDEKAAMLVKGKAALYADVEHDEDEIDEPKSLGGGWYEVADEKIKGKDEAWAKYRSIVGEDDDSE